MALSEEEEDCYNIRNISLSSCISTVLVIYIGAGLFALWKLWRHRKVGYLPLVFLVAGVITAGLTCSVTCIIQAHILCVMKVHTIQPFDKIWFSVILGILEAAFLLFVAVSHSYFNI